MSKKSKNKISYILKISIAIIVIILVCGGLWAYQKYQEIYQPNVSLGEKQTTYFYIPTGSTIENVANLLYEKNFILNRSSFEWVAERKNYKKHIKPGKYLLRAGMNNNDLVDLLRSGKQEPLKITFNYVRTVEQIAGKVGNQIEADSLAIITLFNDSSYLKKIGMSRATVLTLFLPNTYEFYWNTSAEQFAERMTKEYKKFWNEERKTKAKRIGLSQSEVSTLASIVQAEQSIHNLEKPIIAGLYINRIKRGMKLESDPTLVYACGDFSIRRVLNIHKEINSPYNTYLNYGLPPGPINIPEISSVDAVLNYKKNDYIFMCAKPDSSGFHNFSETLRQHTAFAKQFHKSLNKRKIMN